jgi:CIC family chloride channel protein
MVAVADAHAVETSPQAPLKELVRHGDHFLLPEMAIKEAVLAFDRAEAEALAVVDTYHDRRVIGLLTEAFALRRYSAELERRRQELLGEG